MISIYIHHPCFSRMVYCMSDESFCNMKMKRNRRKTLCRAAALLLAAMSMAVMLAGCGKEHDALTQILDSRQMIFGIAPNMEPFAFVPGLEDVLADEELYIVSKSDAPAETSSSDVSGADVSGADTSGADAVRDTADTETETQNAQLQAAGTYYGISVDIARELAAKLNVEPVFVPVAQNDAYNALENGEINVYVGLAAVDIKSAATMNTIDTGLDYRQIFITGQSSEVKKISDIKGHKLGCVRGADTKTALDEAQLISSEAEKIVYFRNTALMLRAVSDGDVDAAAINEPLYIFRTRAVTDDESGETVEPRSRYAVLSSPLAESDMVIAMRLRDKSLSERVGLLYADLEKDGTVENIKAKWLK